MNNLVDLSWAQVNWKLVNIFIHFYPTLSPSVMCLKWIFICSYKYIWAVCCRVGISINNRGQFIISPDNRTTKIYIQSFVWTILLADEYLCSHTSWKCGNWEHCSQAHFQYLGTQRHIFNKIIQYNEKYDELVETSGASDVAIQAFHLEGKRSCSTSL